jgi:hypothetical protein
MKAGVVLIAGRHVEFEKKFRDGHQKRQAGQASILYFGSHNAILSLSGKIRLTIF